MVSYQSILSFDPAIVLLGIYPKDRLRLMCKILYRQAHSLYHCLSKTVNNLNAHPNKEILVFLSTGVHTHPLQKIHRKFIIAYF